MAGGVELDQELPPFHSHARDSHVRQVVAPTNTLWKMLLKGRGLGGVSWQQDIQRRFLDKPISLETIVCTFKNRMNVFNSVSLSFFTLKMNGFSPGCTVRVSGGLGEHFLYISLTYDSHLITQINI